jgi:hypothetical protein
MICGGTNALTSEAKWRIELVLSQESLIFEGGQKRDVNYILLEKSFFELAVQNIFPVQKKKTSEHWFERSDKNCQ